MLYDAQAGRWIITDFAWISSSGPYYECIAVSKTSDPVSGGWWFYAFPAHDTYMNDYPKLGVWPDGIYMSANMFNGNTFAGVRVWALNRDDLYSGSTLRSVYFDVSSSYSSLLPSNLRGTAPPTGSPNFFTSVKSPNIMYLWKFHVDWSSPGSSTFTGPTSLTVASFTWPCNSGLTRACVPELGGEYVDSLGNRLMMQLQYRNIGGT